MVWNPCLGETRWIQYKHSNERYSIFALGYVNIKSGRSYKIIRCWKRYRYSCCETNGPVVETYEFSSDSWRVLDDVTLDEVPHGCVSIKGNIYWANTYTTDDFLLFLDVTKERVKRMCLPQFQYSGCNVLSVVGEEKLALLHLSNFTSKMDMWVTDKIDIDTEAALRWRKSFTVDEPDYVPLPMSFLLDEEKEVALCCACSEVSEFMVYTLGENGNCYGLISYEEESTNTPFIFKYVPSLVQI